MYMYINIQIPNYIMYITNFNAVLDKISDTLVHQIQMYFSMKEYIVNTTIQLFLCNKIFL